jgi:hypothetical protein
MSLAIEYEYEYRFTEHEYEFDASRTGDQREVSISGGMLSVAALSDLFHNSLREYGNWRGLTYTHGITDTAWIICDRFEICDLRFEI